MNTVTAFRSHENCFACGRYNADGLGLIFETDDDAVICRTSVDWRFQSYEGIVHGGILASIADAAMVHLARTRFGGSPVTCRLEMRYKRAVSISEELEAQATVVRSRGGMVWANCRISVLDEVSVEAHAVLKLSSTE